MEEDSIDPSESFISLSLSSKGDQQELKHKDSHEEEKAAAGQNDDVRPKEEDEDAGEESSAGDEPSPSAGLFTHLLPKLPVALPDEQSPTAEEAFLLISIIED